MNADSRFASRAELEARGQVSRIVDRDVTASATAITREPARVAKPRVVGVENFLPFTITLPAPPSLTNSAKGRSRHWWAVNREKKAYWRALDQRQLAGLIPSPGKPIGRALVRIVLTIGGRMDEDNAGARTKWAFDWLATRGYLVNDKLVTWDGTPEQIISRGVEYTIAFTFSPMALR